MREFVRPSQDAIDEGKRIKEEQRAKKIQTAIDNGCKVNYVSCGTNADERETHIYIGSDNEALIDSSIPRDCNKMLDQNYEIRILNLHKENGRLIGLTCSCPRRCITLRNSLSK